MTNYSIDDGNGNQLTTGLSEHNAHATAQWLAGERGESVYLYSTEDGVQSRYETIAPTPADAQRAAARLEFVAMADAVGSYAEAEETAILSVGREFLPPCAIAVLDGGEPTTEYWAFLQSETEKAQAEHDAEYQRGHEWHQ